MSGIVAPDSASFSSDRIGTRIVEENNLTLSHET